MRFLFLSALCCLMIGAIDVSGAVADNDSSVAVFEEIKKHLVQIEVPQGAGMTGFGSGFWIDESGYVATCWHVVKDAPSGEVLVKSAVEGHFDLEKRQIVDANWNVVKAKVVNFDADNDVAILKVEKNPLANPPPAAIKFGDKEFKASYKVAQINPLLPKPGQDLTLGGHPLALPSPIVQDAKVTSITARVPNQEGKVRVLVSTMANHGNSGGPLFNSDGEVVALLQGEIPMEKSRTAIEIAVPVFYASKLLQAAKK